MEAQSKPGLRIAVLVKQIPAGDSLQLGPDGRLVRAGHPVEINPFCRRAIALAVSLARDFHGECVAFTLAPPSGEDALREAVAAGVDSAVLISDPAFAGSDTLATARALVTALQAEGSFDIVICGRNSVDADTGQVGPEIAALLDMPFVASAKDVKVHNDEVFAKSECDDGWRLVRAELPAVLSAAERSCAPARADVTARAAVPAGRIRRLTAESLGPGPWGQFGSPTRVGEVRVVETVRGRMRLTGSLAEQVAEAVRLLSKDQASAAAEGRVEASPFEVSARQTAAAPIAVILEPGRKRSARELCATAARLATQLNAATVGLVSQENRDWPLGSWGLDHAVEIRGARVEEDVAKAVVNWIEGQKPQVILASGSLWGREVAGRVAASLGLGLVGDAVDIDISQGDVSAWKPAFGGKFLARIVASSDPQLITLRPGSPPAYVPRFRDATYSSVEVRPTERITILQRFHEDDGELLFSSRTVVGVGMGVAPADYHLLDPLLEALGATLACTRKVADRGWLPRTRQIGLTGHHISPQLYVAIGLQGNANHVVGIRRARLVLAINSDPGAPIFDEADIGIVGDWRPAVALLTARLAREPRPSAIDEHASSAMTDDRSRARDRTFGAKSCRKLDELEAPTR